MTWEIEWVSLLYMIYIKYEVEVHRVGPKSEFSRVLDI